MMSPTALAERRRHRISLNPVAIVIERRRLVDDGQGAHRYEPPLDEPPETVEFTGSLIDETRTGERVRETPAGRVETVEQWALMVDDTAPQLATGEEDGDTFNAEGYGQFRVVSERPLKWQGVLYGRTYELRKI